MPTPFRRAPPIGRRTAFVASFLLLLIGFCAFVFYLDRYPSPYVDEGFFNLPAARVHDGMSFAVPAAASAPYGETLWAYHAPFYPHLQVLTFRILGVTTFATRIPQYLAGFLAVLLLSIILIRFQCFWCAILVPLVWLGDRSLMESLYGRMDGLALLCLVAALGAFAEWLSTWDAWALFFTGAFAGMAVGFHPVTVVFALGIGITSLLLCPSRSRRSLLLYHLGLALPAAVILSFVAPEFRHAAQQFLWAAGLARRVNSSSHLWTMITVLRWSRYWVLALLTITVSLLLPVSLWIAFRYRAVAGRFTALALSCSLFAVFGCITLVGVSAQLPYYLIYFSLWPAAAVMVILETRVLPTTFIKAAAVAFAILAMAWLPAASWNAMRWREARIFYPLFNPASFLQRARDVIAPGGAVEVSPEYLILARPLGNDITHPWFARANELPRQSWLILSDSDLMQLGGELVPGLSDRRIAYHGLLYPRSAAGGYFTIFTPAALRH
jgi:hypothetical protein